MELSDIYDRKGQDGIDNQNGWDRLPTILKYFIRSQQISIIDRIKRKVSEKYGEAGIRDLVKTSGFRSFKTNSRIGGVSDSLHLFGCAIDFAKKGIFKDNPIPTCCDLECIDSKNCWHIQFKRSLDRDMF